MIVEGTGYSMGADSVVSGAGVLSPVARPGFEGRRPHLLVRSSAAVRVLVCTQCSFGTGAPLWPTPSVHGQRLVAR